MKKYGLMDLIDDVIGFTIIGGFLAFLCIISDVLGFFVFVGVGTAILLATLNGMACLAEKRKKKKMLKKKSQL